MKLVDNAKDGWKWISTWALAAEVALLGTWAKMPETFQNTFSENTLATAGIVIAVVGFVGRFIDQGTK